MLRKALSLRRNDFSCAMKRAKLSVRSSEEKRRMDKYLSLTVGGVSYTVQESILASYPNSLFGRMLQEEWRPESGEPLVINRNGELFRHVIDFMSHKCLPRNKQLKCLLDNDTLVALLDEADYFQLTDLAQDINELLHFPDKPFFDCHREVKNIISDGVDSNLSGVSLRAVFESRVVDALQPFYVPSCVRGTCYPRSNSQIYKSSTTDKLNIEELLADATPSHFGRNSETVFDRSVRDSLEIKAEHLNADTLKQIAKHFPLMTMSDKMCLEARPYKLVIYPEGGHFAPHRDTVRGDNHVGTAVYILKSDFTGGEFLVHSGGDTMMVNKPREWIAMFGDCMHEIRPVLSGVRVTLVYDIYCTNGGMDDEDDEEDAENEEEEDDDEEDDDEEGNYNNNDEDDCDEVHEHNVICAGREIVKRDKKTLIAACRKVGSPFCITLQHLYPKSQSTNHFLKGGDRILFDTLREHFDLQLVPILCCHTMGGEYGGDVEKSYVAAECFKPLSENFDLGGVWSVPLFVPKRKLCEKHLIFYQEYAHFTGNESQEGHRAYLMRGLFASPKVR